MDSREKREFRELKREIKRKGNKHRRQKLKRDLRENPEEAHLSRPTVGRHRSAELNGLDQNGPPRSIDDRSDLD